MNLCHRVDDTWVVVPAYNEATVLGEVTSQLLEHFAHVVVVDDGSTDESATEAARAGAHVVRHPVNLGQGAALQTGIDYVLAEPSMRYVVTFDADGQHQPLDAVAMVARLRAGEAEVAFGSRFLDENTQMSRSKRGVLRAAVAYTNVTTGTRLTDAHNGLRAMTRTVVEQIKITQNGMAHASEVVAQVASITESYVEHPVHIHYTEYSRAKGQSVWNAVNIVADLLLR